MSTFDLQLEAACLAEGLRSPERFDARAYHVGHFTSSVHVAVFQALESLREAGTLRTVGTVALALQRAGRDGLCGGERGIAELAAGNGKTPDPEELDRLHRLRSVYAATAKASQCCGDGDLAGALAALADAGQFGSPSGGEVRTAKQMAEAVLLSIKDAAQGDKRRVYLGMKTLDHAVGKLPIGSLMVVAADTGVGKSGFALSMLVAMARANITCGLISAEDPEDVTGARLLGYFCKISSREIQHITEQNKASVVGELERGVDGLARLGERMLFEDCTGKGDLDVRASMSRMAARGARLVVVDYIGEISSSEKQQDRRNEMRHVAKRLKSHAKRCGVALVLVSQIARPKDTDEFKCPSKHALKESGDITNMAEVIVALWRECASDSEPVRAMVVKCKWGGLGRAWSLQRDAHTGCLREES